MPVASPLHPTDPTAIGAYTLTGRIGEGGQGVVYEARGPGGERVAVKLLHASAGDDAAARRHFEREWSAVRRVAPFCTAAILFADTAGSRPYIVSEYVDGPSLADVLRTTGPLRGPALDRMAIATATALAAIHEAGVVHRDFKPGNVLMGPDGPRVIDFGIARALDAPSVTASGAVGTPAFMAPEQIQGSPAGPPMDMFAWGCTVAAAANGTPPFGNDSIPAVMHRILTQPPLLGALPPVLRGLVAACLDKDPARRPTARQALAFMLGGGRHGNLLADGAAATHIAPTAPALPPVRRRRVHPGAAAGAAAAGVALVVAVPLVVWQVLSTASGGGHTGGPSAGSAAIPVPSDVRAGGTLRVWLTQLDYPPLAGATASAPGLDAELMTAVAARLGLRPQLTAVSPVTFRESSRSPAPRACPSPRSARSPSTPTTAPPDCSSAT